MIIIDIIIVGYQGRSQELRDGGAKCEPEVMPTN